MAIFIEEGNVDFDGDIITCVPIRNGSGKKCPTIKVNFDDELVRYIRQSNKSNYRLAKELGVDPSTIRNARNKKTWRHII